MHPACKKYYRSAGRPTAPCDVCLEKGPKVSPIMAESLSAGGSGSASQTGPIWIWIPVGILLQQGMDEEGTALPFHSRTFCILLSRLPPVWKWAKLAIKVHRNEFYLNLIFICPFKIIFQVPPPSEGSKEPRPCSHYSRFTSSPCCQLFFSFFFFLGWGL